MFHLAKPSTEKSSGNTSSAATNSKSNDENKESLHPKRAETNSKSNDENKESLHPKRAETNSKSNDENKESLHPKRAETNSKSNDENKESLHPKRAETNSKSNDENKEIIHPKRAEDFQKIGDKLCLKLFEVIKECKNPSASKEVHQAIKVITEFLDAILFSPLKLGTKFVVGSTIMDTISKEEVVQTFIKQEIKRMSSNTSSVKDYDMTMWSFFMNGALFPSGFGIMLCNTDGFIDLSRLIIEKLFSSYEKKKNTVNTIHF